MQNLNRQNIILLCIASLIKMLYLDKINILAKIIFITIVIFLSKQFYPFAVILAVFHILFYNKYQENFTERDDNSKCLSNTFEEEGNCVQIYNDEEDEYQEDDIDYDDDQEFPIKEEEDVIQNVDFSDMAIEDDSSYREKTEYEGEEGEKLLAAKLGLD